MRRGHLWDVSAALLLAFVGAPLWLAASSVVGIEAAFLTGSEWGLLAFFPAAVFWGRYLWMAAKWAFGGRAASPGLDVGGALSRDRERRAASPLPGQVSIAETPGDGKLSPAPLAGAVTRVESRES